MIKLLMQAIVIANKYSEMELEDLRYFLNK